MQEETGGEAPCFAHLVQPDARTRRDVARWRRAERARLIAARQALPVAARRAADAELARRLDTELGELAGRTIAAYWPFRGEPDLRSWARRARGRGARVVLPVVVGTGRPLAFRLWQPEATLERGVWDIPVPPATAPELRPDVLLVPVVGLDAARNRLGYGGGYYDRTLAHLHRGGGRPLAIGLGYAQQRIATIFPLPHDIAMDRDLLV